MLQKNFPKNIQPRFFGDPRLEQPDPSLVERLGATVIQFRAPGQDEDVLKSLNAQKSDIRITGIYDSHGSTKNTNDFLFQYVIHPSQGDICIYCQFDVDGVTEEFDEGKKLQIMPQTSGGLQPHDNSTNSWMDKVEHAMWTLRHSLPPVYTLAEVLAKRDLQIPDPIGVFDEIFLNFEKVIIWIDLFSYTLMLYLQETTILDTFTFPLVKRYNAEERTLKDYFPNRQMQPILLCLYKMKDFSQTLHTLLWYDIDIFQTILKISFYMIFLVVA